MEKHCNLCGQDKPATAFFADRSRPDGLTPYCADCIRSRNAMRKGKQRRRGTAPEGMIYCGSCKTAKPASLFGKGTHYPDGLSRYCLECQNGKHKAFLEKNPDYRNAASRKWRAENPERAKDLDRKKNYGLPIGEYDRMLADQGGRCGICRTDRPGGKGSFHVDHCHDTGKVRGLLCNGCNVGLGYFKHSTDNLYSAIQYISRTLERTR